MKPKEERHFLLPHITGDESEKPDQGDNEKTAIENRLNAQYMAGKTAVCMQFMESNGHNED